MSPTSAAPPPARAKPSRRAQKVSPPASGAESGRMVATYEGASSPEAVEGRTLMQNAHLLDTLATHANDLLTFPFDVPLLGSQCDVDNAFWDPSDKKVTICYEDAEHSLRIFKDADDTDPAKSAVNAEIATFYHELGHATIDIYDLPATGREEDVADQLAAYMLLEPDENGEIDPENVRAAKDYARMFRAYAAERGEVGDDAFADEHPLNQARMYNFECWIYGSDPRANADIVADGLLPKRRAEGCEAEYNRLAQAWSALLAPHLK
ncbi:hypothetical protein Mycch_2949 [Mycolicibacterium chubuense NBB4]|uniref:Uncharacterized protein n=1 Tax=Mycolicibacterium chubuense (strain NBB4) TaxID=710421 RepID=I4BK99_MYCCN|nr:hypothetical protein Mycch_2949 [Mycolicibacterium chubuense NBB4]